MKRIIKFVGPGLLMLIAGVLLLIFDKESHDIGRLMFFGWIATSLGIGYMIALRFSKITWVLVALTILLTVIVGAIPIVLLLMFSFRP